jgi:signal transduction histidine kinase
LTTLREDGDLDRLRLTDLPRVVRDVEAEGLHVNLELEGDGATVTHPVQAAVVRVVQESLANVLKHSTGRTATVRVCLAAGVQVSVIDDGEPVGDGDGGLGIVGMRERAALLGGELWAGPRAGGGFEVHATLPARSTG